jgi:hypothetical protein
VLFEEVLTCTPKVDPEVMLVTGLTQKGGRLNGTEVLYPRTNHPQTP